jgi:hypothetical protein
MVMSGGRGEQTYLSLACIRPWLAASYFQSFNLFCHLHIRHTFDRSGSATARLVRSNGHLVQVPLVPFLTVHFDVSWAILFQGKPQLSRSEGGIPVEALHEIN